MEEFHNGQAIPSSTGPIPLKSRERSCVTSVGSLSVNREGCYNRVLTSEGHLKFGFPRTTASEGKIATWRQIFIMIGAFPFEVVCSYCCAAGHCIYSCQGITDDLWYHGFSLDYGQFTSESQIKAFLPCSAIIVPLMGGSLYSSQK